MYCFEHELSYLIWGFAAAFTFLVGAVMNLTRQPSYSFFARLLMNKRTRKKLDRLDGHGWDVVDSMGDRLRQFVTDLFLYPGIALLGSIALRVTALQIGDVSSFDRYDAMMALIWGLGSGGVLATVVIVIGMMVTRKHWHMAVS